MRLAFLTDIHFEFLHDRDDLKDDFIRSVRDSGADSCVITGDISNGKLLENDIRLLAGGIGMPLYFVLGNHDSYESSRLASQVLASVIALETESTYLTGTNDPILLSDHAALVGHDGWCDCRIGRTGLVEINDFRLIIELKFGGKSLAYNQCAEWADEAARVAKGRLEKAFAVRDRVVFATHVPPFAESCWYLDETDGITKLSGSDYLPYFTSKAMGDMLMEEMVARPDKNLLVLCGHSHGKGEVDILPNLKVMTGGAAYGKPEIQGILDV